MRWLVLCIFLAGCSGLGALIPTPGVVANVQAGAAPSQNVGQTRNVTVTGKGSVDASEAAVRADTVQTQTINQTPPWLLVALVIGWLAPSPGEIARWVRGLFGRK